MDSDNPGRPVDSCQQSGRPPRREHFVVESQGDKRPLNAIEQGVARIWAELLNVETVHASANFLELGGESLLASEAVDRIRTAFGCDIQVRSVFVSTVAEIAAEIASHTARRSDPALSA